MLEGRNPFDLKKEEEVFTFNAGAMIRRKVLAVNLYRLEVGLENIASDHGASVEGRDLLLLEVEGVASLRHLKNDDLWQPKSRASGEQERSGSRRGIPWDETPTNPPGKKAKWYPMPRTKGRTYATLASLHRLLYSINRAFAEK